jgi:hypothetical protein
MSITQYFADIKHQKSVIETKLDILDCFIHIIHRLADVYRIRTESLHAFYDLDGSMVAFNQNGCIFLNLRSFEEKRK